MKQSSSKLSTKNANEMSKMSKMSKPIPTTKSPKPITQSTRKMTTTPLQKSSSHKLTTQSKSNPVSSSSSNIITQSNKQSLPSNSQPIPFTLSPIFRQTTPSLALGGGRSKGGPVKKRFDTPDTTKPKKDLTQDDKDKKKLEKLEREKAKQATRQAQLTRSAERGKKELDLASKKQQQLISSLQGARIQAAAIDDAERLELEKNAKQNQLDEEAEKLRRANRRVDPTAV
jgi:hypothetical protein